MTIHRRYVETPVGMAISPQFPHGECGQWGERAVCVHCKDHVHPHLRRRLKEGGDWTILVVRNWIRGGVVVVAVEIGRAHV